MTRVVVALILAFALQQAAAAEPAVTQLDRAKTQSEAQAGDLDAAFMLGRMYRDGVGGPEDKATARVWLAKAADGGHVRAAVLLGLMLMAGQGGKVDRNAARPYLLYAASAHDQDALYAMGVLFAEGTTKGGGGPQQDGPSALFWFRAAAERGNVDGMYNLGLLYLRGLGTPADPPEAYKWFLEAAEAGEAQAQFVVATLLHEGRGVMADPKQALIWYLRAKANGMVDDALEVDLTKALSPEDVADAKRAASEEPATRANASAATTP